MKLTVQLEEEGDTELFEDLERYLRYHPRVTRFLFNPAGFIFIMGWILYVGMVIGWIGIWLVDKAAAEKCVAVVIAELTGGREAAIPLGIITFGLPPLLVAGISFTQDLISTAWIYPAFYLFRERNVGRDNFAGYFFAKMEHKAEEHKEFIERYGAVGLFLFMLIPFAINGPLIGAIIGKLAGIRTRYILPTVILATFTATALWTGLWYFASGPTQRFIDRFGAGWIALGMATIFAFVILATVIGFMRDVRRYKQLRRDRDAAAALDESKP